jgi:hypothetical protein
LHIPKYVERELSDQDMRQGRIDGAMKARPESEKSGPAPHSTEIEFESTGDGNLLPSNNESGPLAVKTPPPKIVVGTPVLDFNDNDINKLLENLQEDSGGETGNAQSDSSKQ